MCMVLFWWLKNCRLWLVLLFWFVCIIVKVLFYLVVVKCRLMGLFVKLVLGIILFCLFCLMGVILLLCFSMVFLLCVMVLMWFSFGRCLNRVLILVGFFLRCMVLWLIWVVSKVDFLILSLCVVFLV